mgnify:CR=1 FL=1
MLATDPKVRKITREVFSSALILGLIFGAILGWGITRVFYEIPAHVEWELTGWCPTCERGR